MKINEKSERFVRNLLNKFKISKRDETEIGKINSKIIQVKGSEFFEKYDLLIHKMSHKLIY